MKPIEQKGLEIIFIIISISILLFLHIKSINRESRVFDEITYVKAGYGFLTKHDFRLDPFNPPLAREIVALPVLINKSNLDDPVLFWPRLMVLFFSLSLALLVYIFTKKLYGIPSAVLALILFIFEPTLLANGHYATMDFIFSFFYILTLYLYCIWRKKLTFKKISIFSIFIGLTLSTKISAITFLLPIFPIIFLFEKKNKSILLKYYYWKKRITYLILFVCISLLSLWSTYFFTFEPALGNRFDPNRPAIALAKNNYFVHLALTVPTPLGSYISSLKQIILFNYSNLYSKNSMFFGNVSSNGFPGYYFPALLLIKLPLALIILFFLSILFMLNRNKNNKFIIIPIITIFISILLTKVMLVTRYILPVIPLIIIYASQSANFKFKNNLISYCFFGILIAWYISGIINVFPHYISYANELVGGTKNAYKYVFDANYDWGQGLIDLKNYQKKNQIENLQLAYFGDIDPAIVGIKYERIYDAQLFNNAKATLKYDNDHVIAISATCWYLCGYYKNSVIKDKTPDDIVGGSILIFKKD